MSIEYFEKIGIHPSIIVVGVILVWLINKLPNFINYFDYHRNRRKDKIESLDKAIDSNLSSYEKELLTNIRCQALFKDATGFDDVGNIRKFVAKFILNSGDKYSLDDFIRIRKYIKFNKDRDNIVIDIEPYFWFGLSLMRYIFIFLIMVIAFEITLAILFVKQAIQIYSINPGIPVLSFLVPIILAILYAPDSKEYTILDRLYESNRNMFLHSRPNKLYIFTVIVIYSLDFYALVLWMYQYTT